MRVRGALPGTRREGLIGCAGLLLPTASRAVANRDPLFFPGRWSIVRPPVSSSPVLRSSCAVFATIGPSGEGGRRGE